MRLLKSYCYKVFVNVANLREYKIYQTYKGKEQKMGNRVLKKKISDYLNQNKQSLDDINQHIYDVILINRLTNSEVAALFTGLMREILSSEHNKKLLNNLGIDIGQLNPELTTKIQQILTEEWLANQGLLK